MGVKDLWSILDPAAESYTLADLHGKCLAVDISGWIFQSKEAQKLAGKDGIHPHLRTLFWRLFHLMKNHVRLLIVFDGPRPDLKVSAIQQKTMNPPIICHLSEKSKFLSWSEECKQLLSIFKIPYIMSEGDAEATCAQLNQNGVVDGCISDDSDTFLFGAVTVYRHFSCDPTKVNSMKCYKMEAIKRKLKLNREHLISLALLLGCDYDVDGVRGIGREQAIRLMKIWENLNPLERMTKWRQDSEVRIKVDRRMPRKPRHCRRCGHLGSGVDHGISGCATCQMTEGCNKTEINSVDRICTCSWHQTAELSQSYELETKVKEAALKDPSFPRNELIKAYQAPVSVPNIVLDWPRPTYTEAEECLSKLFKWDQKKIVVQLASYFTAYDICSLIRRQISGDSYPEGISRPDKILGLKHQHHRELYVVQWKAISGLPISRSGNVITHEFKDNFSAAYPQVAANYEGWLVRSTTPTKSPSRKRKSPGSATSQGQQTTMERYSVVRKSLFRVAAEVKVEANSQ